MYERITRTVEITCRDCDTTFTHETRANKPKLLCDSCLKESRRAATREYQRRRRAALKAERPARLCQDCGADISDRRGRALRCIPCVRAQRAAEQRVLREAKPREPSRFWCVKCEIEIERIGNSGKPLYCPPCKESVRVAGIRRQTRRRRALKGTTFATHCNYCDAEFSTPRQRGRTPARCADCKKKWHRNYIRAYYAMQPRGYDHVRRARKMGLGYERFKVVEIFQRDGWKCGICDRSISQRLRYPHPMSASLDHKIPLSRGGHHSRLNTQASHLRCNLRKRTHVAPMGVQIPLPI
jgi:hypothetical protein